MDAAVVELDSLADPVRAGAEDDDARLVSVGRGLVRLAPGRVEVVRARLDLGRAGVDPPVRRPHAPTPPLRPHDLLARAAARRDLRVRDPRALEANPVVGDEIVGVRDGGRSVSSRRSISAWNHGWTPSGRSSVGPGRLGACVQLARAARLQERLAERAADAHRLADRLHLRAERRVRAGELLEGEARELDDDVVECRLEARGRRSGQVVRDLVERVADRELRGDLRDRIAGRLRGERGRARNARVHLDHPQLAGLAARARTGCSAPPRLDADRADDRDRRVAELLVGVVREGHLRGDGDRVARVDPHRVEVLDRADDDGVVCAVAHQLELELVPAEERLLDEHLADRALGQRPLEHAARALRASGPCPPPWPPSVNAGRRITGSERSSGHVAGRGDDRRLGNAQPGRAHGLAEALAVLCALDDVDRSADQLDAELFEDALLGQRDGEVESGLAAHRRQQRVGPLALEHACHALEVERLEIRAVGEAGVGHDRRRVRVDDDRPEPVLAQHLQRLAARVVELAGLADDDRPGADQADRLEVTPPWQGRPPPRSSRRTSPSASCGPGPASGWNWTERARSSGYSRPSTVPS